MLMPVRAIVVDDVPTDLLVIGTALAAAGIPIVSHWYDRSEVNINKRLQPAPPTGGYEHIRLLISDLNLDEVSASQELAVVISPVLTAIRQLLAKSNGPYMLIFWTGTSHKIEDIRAIVLERLSAMELPQPFAVEGLSKASFTVTAGQGPDALVPLYQQAHGHAANLRAQIDGLLVKHSMLNMLSQWEARASVAASAATNGIFSAAKIDGPSDVSQSLTRIAALISREAIGADLAKLEPAKAFDAAMIDLLVDHFGRSVSEPGYRVLAASSLQNALKNQDSLTPSKATMAGLNTRFQLDTNTQGVRFRDRGAVISLEAASKGGHQQLAIDPKQFMWTDFFWRPGKKESGRQKKLDDEIREAISAQFSGDSKVREQVDSAFDRVRTGRRTVLKARYDYFKANEEPIAEAVKWVLIEIGADCDHAQGKTRTLRFVLAAQYRTLFNEYVRGPDGEPRNAALRKLGPFQDADGEFYLLVSYKRFVTWQLVDKVKDPSIPVMYRLRKSVVDELLHRYANWSSRAGIVEFVVTD